MVPWGGGAGGLVLVPQGELGGGGELLPGVGQWCATASLPLHLLVACPPASSCLLLCDRKVPMVL